MTETEQYKEEISKFKKYLGAYFYYYPEYYKGHYGWIMKAVSKLDLDGYLSDKEKDEIKQNLYNQNLEKVWDFVCNKIETST